MKEPQLTAIGDYIIVEAIRKQSTIKLPENVGADFYKIVSCSYAGRFPGEVISHESFKEGQVVVLSPYANPMKLPGTENQFAVKYDMIIAVQNN